MNVTPQTRDRLSGYLDMAIHTVGKSTPFYWPAYLTADEVVRTPLELFPAFHTSFDWHSCVHGYWCITRILALGLELPRSGQALKVLSAALTPEKIQGEMLTLMRSEYRSFERPYGLGWVCKLAAELHQWQDCPAAALKNVVAPLAELASRRIIEWHQQLTYPVQSGEHSQSAFGLDLVWEYAVAFGNARLVKEVNAEIDRLYVPNRLSILHAEPSGHDFLSPSLACAVSVGRVLDPKSFAGWLSSYIPGLNGETSDGWLAPAKGHLANDGKLSHLIGLNLSRAWMLRRISVKLPTGDWRAAVLDAAALLHADVGHQAVDQRHFESSHWLASFAVFEMTDVL